MQEGGGPDGPFGTGPAAMVTAPAALLKRMKLLPRGTLPVLPLLLLL